MSATCSTAMVTVGSTRLDQVVKPAGGKTGMSTANTVMSISPVQEVGHGLAGDGDGVGGQLAAGVGVPRHPDTRAGSATTVVSRIAATDRVMV